MPPTDGTSTSQRSIRRADWFNAAVLFMGMSALYRTTTVASPSWDGVYYCFQIASGDPAQFLHGQHLLYHATGRLLYAALSLFVPNVSVWSALLLLSAISGAACVATMYGVCRLLGLHRPAAIMGSLGLGVSIEFWRHAANVEYIVPNALLLCLLLLQMVRYSSVHTARAACLMGGLLGLSVLGHLRHLLVLPAVLPVVLGAPRRWARLGVVLAAGAGAVAVGYALGGLLSTGRIDPIGIAQWALLHTFRFGGSGASSWWVWNPRNFLWAPIWLVSAIVDSGHVQHLLWAPDRFSGLVAMLCVVVCVGVIGGCASAVITLRRNAAQIRRVVVALVVWVVLYAGAFSSYCPGEGAWWVASLVPLWLLVAIGIDGSGLTRARLLHHGVGGLVVASVAAVNLVGAGGIVSAHRHMEPQLAHLFRLHQDAEVGDLVLWLGYLWTRPFGGAYRDVAPGIQDNPQALDQAKHFAPVLSFGTLELLRNAPPIRRVVAGTLGAGRTVWVSLSECTVERTVARAGRFDQDSARALARFLNAVELKPTSTDCLWTIRGGAAVSSLRTQRPEPGQANE